MANVLSRLGQLNAWLLPILRGYATSGVAGALAAVYCVASGASPELSALLVPVATTLGELLERKIGAWLGGWKTRKAGPEGTTPGSVVDHIADTGKKVDTAAAYLLNIKGYCGHDGVWRIASVAVHTVGMAKGGGWWKAETMDGRIYDLDRDQWL